MANPNGAIQAIGSAASTAMAVGVAFLGYWGFGSVSGSIPWAPTHWFVLIPGAIGFCLLAYVPYIATRADNEEQALLTGRYAYAAGVVAVLCAIFISFVI